MTGWPTVSLGDVASIERKVVEASAIEDGTMYVGLENIQSGGNLINVREVSRGELASSKFTFTSRHVLYGKLRPYLAKIARPTFSGICSTDILPVLPSPILDRDYMAQFLLHPDVVALANSRATGANLPRLNPRALGEIQIPLPPLEVQWRIAALLGHAEGLRAQRRAALATLDTLAEAILVDLLRNRGSIEEVSTELLGDYLLFVTSGSRGWARYYAPNGRRFIRSLDVQMNYISNDDAVYVAPPENAEARRTEVSVGDLLLTITGSRIGRVATVPNDLEGAFVSQHVAILRVDPARIEPTYLSSFLTLGAGGQRQIANAQYGQTKPGLNLEQIRRFEVPVPSVRLQQTFVRRVSSVEKLKAAHRASLAEFNALIAALQRRAFQDGL